MPLLLPLLKVQLLSMQSSKDYVLMTLRERNFFLHLLDSSFVCQKGIIALDDKDNGMKSMKGLIGILFIQWISFEAL